MTDENPALRAELVKKAKKAKVAVTPDMTVEDLEKAIGDAAMEAPEPEVTEVTTIEAGTVKCRVTKVGDGQIFTGNGNERYSRNDIIVLPIKVAEDLEKRHFVEID